MPHVITERCCNDAACVSVCPVNCIHPSPGEADYLTAEMLYIDPEVCINCGACVAVCPVSAIVPDFDLEPEQEIFERINASFYEVSGRRDYVRLPVPTVGRSVARTGETLRVAVVGTGPAASYVVDELLKIRGLDVRVDVFERLPVPGGLARFGVAPDHAQTKDVLDRFDKTLKRENVRVFLNTEIGTDITHDELARRYSAVVYANGASASRHLGIPGEELPGSVGAPEFVAWYNGHPDFREAAFDLSGTRAVVVGNGNVALDVARILASDPKTLAKTDIADHALEALRSSNITEVVVLGRRDASSAAFTLSEVLGLAQNEDFDVTVDFGGEPGEAADALRALKLEQLQELADVTPTRKRRIVLRFLSSPVALIGQDHVEALEVSHNRMTESGAHTAVPTGTVERLETSLVVRSIGYRGRAMAGLPFDASAGTLPNEGGRVIDPASNAPVAGVYTAGWIKRGPTGVIGTNKKDAAATVDALIADWESGALGPAELSDDVAALLPNAIDYQGWSRIDRQERAEGRRQGRPRVKIVDVEEMRQVALATESA
ncbi:FAD-dependent oxidoreductase [Microbacterium sp. X-17]|uniref:FAD-dependent oxidoreductase n=1 Tax=Microbacterium sp. X-17 TaxID=3144404 RepID=UPI0031F5A939